MKTDANNHLPIIYQKMFRNIGRIGHLLTFEHNAWRTNYTTVYVPVSLVTLQLDKHGVVVSSMDNVWISHHDTHEDAKKEFREFLSCIHPSKPIRPPRLGFDAMLQAATAQVVAENRAAADISKLQ